VLGESKSLSSLAPTGTFGTATRGLAPDASACGSGNLTPRVTCGRGDRAGNLTPRVMCCRGDSQRQRFEPEMALSVPSPRALSSNTAPMATVPVAGYVASAVPIAWPRSTTSVLTAAVAAAPVQTDTSSPSYIGSPAHVRPSSPTLGLTTKLAPFPTPVQADRGSSALAAMISAAAAVGKSYARAMSPVACHEGGPVSSHVHGSPPADPPVPKERDGLNAPVAQGGTAKFYSCVRPGLATSEGPLLRSRAPSELASLVKTSASGSMASATATSGVVTKVVSPMAAPTVGTAPAATASPWVQSSTTYCVPGQPSYRL